VDKGGFGDRLRRLCGQRTLSVTGWWTTREGLASNRWSKRLTRSVAALCVVTLPVVGCGHGSGTQSGGDAVVVYCSADKEFAEQIFNAYEARTGHKVLPLYDTEETKTAGLTARLIAERSSPKADVFWSSDTSRAVALVDQGLAAAFVPQSAATIPPRYRDANGRWTGFGARIRVLLYNTERVSAADVPRSILDLTNARWKSRFAIANPHFGTMSFHTSALFVKWGDARAADFLRRLHDNGAVIAAGNSDVKDRIADGRVDVGLLDEDDAVVAIRDKKPVAIAILDQDGADPLGTPLMPNVALLIDRAPHPDAGRQFIEFLVSADAERILAGSDAAQYPLHPGAAGPRVLPPLDRIRVMDVDYLEVARRLPGMDEAIRTIFGL
jgi:iron(III) transport system substrate-binding protein